MNAHFPTDTSMHHAFHVDCNFNIPIPGSSAGQQETGSPRTSAASCVGIDQPRNKDQEDDIIGMAASDTNSVPRNVDTGALCHDVEVDSPPNANIDAVSPEAVTTNPLKADSSNTDTDECSSGTKSSSGSAPLHTCMQPVDLGQYIADNFESDIFCVAPGEGSVPISVFNKEAECFPVLFPTGKDTFMDETRSNKITFSQYTKTRLFSSDNKFSKNPEYIFYLQYIKEFREVLQSAQIYLRKGTPVNSLGDALTAEMLTSSQNLTQLVNRNEGYKFLKTVRGTSAYWEKQTRDLFAMVVQLGIPTWFASFSAADQRWPEITQAILTQQGKPIPENITWEQHCEIINSNPVTAARMFDKRARNLIHDLIITPANIIGDIVDFYFRIEFQQRGKIF